MYWINQIPINWGRLLTAEGIAIFICLLWIMARYTKKDRRERYLSIVGLALICIIIFLVIRLYDANKFIDFMLTDTP